jgi:hypothetical protein
MDYRKDQVNEELKQISPALAKIVRINVFAVPPFYFQQLPLDILTLIQSDTEQISPSFSNKTPYCVPTGYFEGLAKSILQKVAIDDTISIDLDAELQTIAPLLNTINKKMLYSVPDGYFDTPRYAPHQEIVNKKVTFAVLKGIYRYAAAAVITGVVAMGTYFFIRQGTSSTNNNVANIRVELEKVSDIEIATYLNNNNFAVDVNSTNFFLNEELPIQEYIKNLSEDEIRNYLKENGALKKEI